MKLFGTVAKLNRACKEREISTIPGIHSTSFSLLGHAHGFARCVYCRDGCERGRAPDTPGQVCTADCVHPESKPSPAAQIHKRAKKVIYKPDFPDDLPIISERRNGRLLYVGPVRDRRPANVGQM